MNSCCLEPLRVTNQLSCQRVAIMATGHHKVKRRRVAIGKIGQQLRVDSAIPNNVEPGSV